MVEEEIVRDGRKLIDKTRLFVDSFCEISIAALSLLKERERI